MGKTRAGTGRVIGWLGAGAAVGGCLAAVDGFVLGAMFAGSWALWTGGFALGGAALGGLLGLLAVVFGLRMVLQPPDDEEAR